MKRNSKTSPINTEDPHVRDKDARVGGYAGMDFASHTLTRYTHCVETFYHLGLSFPSIPLP
jgi:hypothetical protein